MVAQTNKKEIQK